ncbi:alpha/beta hydrolase [Nocardia asteroides]|uniref:alpha/beta hydrolase n=1 Tax=Nocardia asteroides TaxID=1824 RepID=UPI0037CC8B0B
MPFFDGPSGQVHYRQWRTAHPRIGVVLLHGLGQQSADYHRFCRFLNRHDIDVWGLDHLGHGLSEGDFPTDPPMPELATAALRLITRVRSANPSLPLALVGHSLGAGTALIAMESGAPATQEISTVVLTGTPERAHFLDVPAPPVPTLVLHGQDDRRAPLEPIRAWCADHPTTTFRVFPDTGHDLLHEPAHRAVSDAIVDFLREPGRPVARPMRFEHHRPRVTRARQSLTAAAH